MSRIKANEETEFAFSFTRISDSLFMFLQAILTLLKVHLGTWLHLNKQGQIYVWFLSDKDANRGKKKEDKYLLLFTS